VEHVNNTPLLEQERIVQLVQEKELQETPRTNVAETTAQSKLAKPTK
jgi:hypothetical protein